MLEYDELKKIRLNWKQQAEKIEKDYNAAQVKQAGVGVAGAGLGVAVVALGPTAAMGVATTFGVASTGTAISSLSGAAATNAALAWLGGGAIAAGGGGKLHKATDRINSFGLDYNNMTEAQQYELGAYVNLMSSATQLLVNPIIGIQAKYTEEDYNAYLSWREKPLKESKDDICE